MLTVVRSGPKLSASTVGEYSFSARPAPITAQVAHHENQPFILYCSRDPSWMGAPSIHLPGAYTCNSPWKVTQPATMPTDASVGIGNQSSTFDVGMKSAPWLNSRHIHM